MGRGDCWPWPRTDAGGTVAAGGEGRDEFYSHCLSANLELDLEICITDTGSFRGSTKSAWLRAVRDLVFWGLKWIAGSGRGW